MTVRLVEPTFNAAGVRHPLKPIARVASASPPCPPFALRDTTYSAGAGLAVAFGVGFLAPLIAQSMDALKVPAPFGLSTIAFGLIVGSTAGLVAKLRGSWV